MCVCFLFRKNDKKIDKNCNQTFPKKNPSKNLIKFKLEKLLIELQNNFYNFNFEHPWKFFSQLKIQKFCEF
jgi:hypothetical protein